MADQEAAEAARLTSIDVEGYEPLPPYVPLSPRSPLRARLTAIDWTVVPDVPLTYQHWPC